MQHANTFLLTACGWQRVQEAMAVECICMGIVRYEACDFHRVNQAIRMQKRPCVCWKSSHFKVHVHKKLATEKKVNSKTYWGGRAVSIVQILKIIQVWLLFLPGVTLCHPKITSQAFYSDELLQIHSVKWILCQQQAWLKSFNTCILIEKMLYLKCVFTLKSD